MKKITLKSPHTHAGVLYFPGGILELRSQQADWLCQQMVGAGEAASPVAVPYTGSLPAANTTKPEPKPSEAKT